MTTIRVSEFISSFISDVLEVSDVFILTGAGIMDLTDGVAKNPKLRAICPHHEQSASMALEAYARATENFGVGYFSTGPASTNAITGLGGAWQDSVPCLFISGQVKRSEASVSAGVDRLRQFGVQELNIIPVVKTLTKYAVHLSDPNRVRYELEKAVYLAKSGRPGPVWLEVPMDVQASRVDPNELEGFQPPAEAESSHIRHDVLQVHRILAASKRPVIIAGRGVRIAQAQTELLKFATDSNIPVVTPYLGVDNLSHLERVFIGKPGVKGDRAANLAMQNADLILAIGTSLHVSVTGYNYAQFAREAKKIVVDVDPTSHKKGTVHIDHLIQTDAKLFLESLLNCPEKLKFEPEWLEMCRNWRSRYPVCLPEYAKGTDGINIYSFVEELSRLAGPNDCVVSDAGSAFYAVTQGLRLTSKAQRYITSGGMATMGYSLPAAIGISAALGNGRVLAVTGDGSLQLNIQELQTLVHYQFPVKLFVLNNDGYLSIRASQRNYYQERYIGSGPNSGVSVPDTMKIADAYGIPASRVQNLESLEKSIQIALSSRGPYILEVMTPSDQLIIPTVSSVINADGSMSSRPLEDMFPFLDEKEYERNMIISPIQR